MTGKSASALLPVLFCGTYKYVVRATKKSAVPTILFAIVVAYVVALGFGWPQAATREIVAASSAAESSHVPAVLESPSFWAIGPFVVLLAGIALLPILPQTLRWWESNLNRFLFAGGLASVTLGYYALLHHSAVEGHWPAHHLTTPVEGHVQTGLAATVLANAILREFVPFIVLLFSLYTISGGIHITGDLRARPTTNAAFMCIGSLLASVIGTTGVAMLLIRPLLETNRERKYVAHTVLLFIFTACNCGGCLLPIGDPPLFLGYLEGVPFLWTLQLWREWLFVNGMLIAAYLLIDSLWYYRHEAAEDSARYTTRLHRIRIAGWQLNAPLLLGVVLAIALLDPSKSFLGTDWHPWMYLREIVQMSLVGVSLWFGDPKIRDANTFTYGVIIEVAALFVGIFICMQPALQILSTQGQALGLSTPSRFFWLSGGLSSVLDNAPTYLVFFKTAQTLPRDPIAATVAGVNPLILAAVSLGSVFMGAMTYIGNGPNFMVRSIAESAGVKMPTFFGYLVYSCLILLPILALTVWLFLM